MKLAVAMRCASYTNIKGVHKIFALILTWSIARTARTAPMSLSVTVLIDLLCLAFHPSLKFTIYLIVTLFCFS